MLVCFGAGGACAQEVLFVGNSFTFYPGPLGVGEVNALSGGHFGGVPALFHAVAVAGGRAPVVHMAAEGGKDLRFHYENRRHLLSGRRWDVVVLQDYSTGPLVRGDDRSGLDSFRDHVGRFKAIFAGDSGPGAAVWLYETWARPDLVKEGEFASLMAMQSGLHEAYASAARDFALAGYAPVGGAFLTAVRQGLADDPSTETKEGALRLWGDDHYHQNATGSYLAALVLYGCIYNTDPRELPNNNDAATACGLSADDSRALQQLAWESVEATRATR